MNTRFDVGRRLGHGEMGVVYEGIDRSCGRAVALKVYRQDDEVTLERVRRVVERLRGMRHVNVVEVIDLVEDGDIPMLVMERIEGEDMMAYVAGRWRSELPGADGSPVRCDVARLRSCLTQLVAGLIELHRRGVVHCDLKPANLRVTAEGRLVILDFSLSGTGGPGGTIAYMAPEQAIIDAVVGGAADWYSLGVIAYEALTGRLPFDGPPQRVLQEKAQREPVPVDELVAGAPADLVALCRALLVPDPERRPADEELARRIGLAEMPRPRPRATPPGRRKRAVEHVFDRLRAAADKGRAGLVALVGESGLGRTTALGEVAAAARAAWPAAVVMEIVGAPGALDRLGERLAAAWGGLAESEQRAIVPGHPAALAALVPVLGTVPAVAAAVPATARAPRLGEAIDALRETLTLLSRRRPVVVLVDDLDELDADSATVLADVLRAPDPPPVLLVGTCVDESRLPAIERLIPVPLDWSSRTEIETLLAERSTPPEIARGVVALSEGNPTLAIELARAASLGEPAGGGGLIELLAARIARLPAATRDLMVAVDRTGGTVLAAVLAAALDLDPATLADALAELERAGLASAQAVPAGTAIAPLRRAVRSALAGTVEPGDARRIARALAAGAELPPVLRAQLWHEAGDDARAGDDAELAGEEARRRLRFVEAMAMYRLAVEGGRHDLQRALADCAAAAGKGAIAARAYAAAAGYAGDAADALTLFVRAAEHHVLAGELDAGLVRFREALGRCGVELAPSPARAIPRLLARRAWLRIRGIGYERVSAVDVPRFDLAAADACFMATYHLGVLETVIGAELQARALSMALRLGEPERIGRSAVLESFYLASQGAIARSARMVQLAREAAAAAGSREVASFALLGEAANAFFHENRFTTVLALCDAHLRDVLDEPDPAGWSIDIAQTFGCFALTYLGDIHELARRVHTLVREAARRGDRYASMIYRVRCNLAWLARGDEHGADEALAAAERDWPFEGPHFRVPDFYRIHARVERALWGGDAAQAERIFESGREALERSLLTRVHRIRAEVDTLGARIAIARAAPGHAAGAARRWLRRLRANPVGIAPVWAALLTGCAALHDGDRAGATGPLRDAIAGADALALGLQAAAARIRLDEPGEVDRALHDLARLGVTDVRRTMAMIAP